MGWDGTGWDWGRWTGQDGTGRDEWIDMGSANRCTKTGNCAPRKGIYFPRYLLVWHIIGNALIDERIDGEA